MKRETQDKKGKKLVKCRFNQKLRCPRPCFPAALSTPALVAAVVTRKVSEEGIEIDTPTGTAVIRSRQVEIPSPLSPSSVVGSPMYDTRQSEGTTGRLASAPWQVETTVRSISDSSLDQHQHTQGTVGGTAYQRQRAMSTSSGLLRRQAKSVCLAELASPRSPPPVSPPDTSTTNHHHYTDPMKLHLCCEHQQPSPKSSAATWGLFVDLDEHHHQVLPLRVDQYRRRPLQLRRRCHYRSLCLAGIDEATSQLENLSFQPL